MGTLTTTNYAWQYPDSGGSDRIWEHYATIFPDIDADLHTAEAKADALNAGVWTSYTPTWLCASGSNPALGNGTIAGRWRYLNPTETHLHVIVEITLTMGSTTTYGTGVWVFSLPFSQSASGRAIGSAVCTDTGSTTRCAAVKSGSGVTNVQVITNAGQATATVPHTWASTDVLEIAFSYEKA